MDCFTLSLCVWACLYICGLRMCTNLMCLSYLSFSGPGCLSWGAGKGEQHSYYCHPPCHLLWQLSGGGSRRLGWKDMLLVLTLAVPSGDLQTAKFSSDPSMSLLLRGLVQADCVWQSRKKNRIERSGQALARHSPFCLLLALSAKFLAFLPCLLAPPELHRRSTCCCRGTPLLLDCHRIYVSVVCVCVNVVSNVCQLKVSFLPCCLWQASWNLTLMNIAWVDFYK